MSIENAVFPNIRYFEFPAGTTETAIYSIINTYITSDIGGGTGIMGYCGALKYPVNVLIRTSAAQFYLGESGIAIRIYINSTGGGIANPIKIALICD